MLNYLKGTTTEVNETSVVLETNLIGFQIVTLAKDSYNLLENYKIYIYDHINSDNEPVLYGFLDLNDIKVFKLLIKISGIGAKTAHNILNNTGANILIALIQNKDIESLRKVSGVGSKANMIYYELRNKLKEFDVNLLRYENVYTALMQMHYDPSEIRSALVSIDQDLSDEDALKEAIKRMNYERK